MPELNKDTFVQRNPKLLSNQMDGEIVMMSIDNGEYYGLDEIGSRIWELMEKPVSLHSLAEQLMAEFDVDYEDCLRDTKEFLTDLFDKDLVLVKNEPV
jgi:hypothetical protein